MAKRTDRPEGLTEEQRARLLEAGERLLAAGVDPVPFLLGAAMSEEELRRRVPDPAGAETSALLRAAKEAHGCTVDHEPAWLAPSFLRRIRRLRGTVFDARTLRDSDTAECVPADEWISYRLKMRANELRQLTDAIRTTPSGLKRTDVRRREATRRAFLFHVDTHDMAEKNGLSLTEARRILAPKYGYRATPGTYAQAEDASIARWIARQKKARELFDEYRRRAVPRADAKTTSRTRKP